MHNALNTIARLTDILPLTDDNNYRLALDRLTEKQQTLILNKPFSVDRCLSLGAVLLAQTIIKENQLAGELYHDENGKPHIGNDEVHIAITHCYPYAAVVISPFPCGIDIESEAIDFRQIVKHYYTDEEKSYLAQNNNCQKLITQLWCRKECYIKFDRPQELRSFSVVKPPQEYNYFSYSLPGYALEILAKGNCSLTKIDLNDLLFNEVPIG